MKITRFLPTLIMALFLAAPGLMPAQSGDNAVEIMVWVHDKNEFVDDLTLEDFEIYEDGELQRSKSLRLIRERSVIREEIPGPSSPDLHRNFFLLYQTVDWDPRLGEAVEHLFHSLMLPGDTMTLVTPMNSYTLAPDSLARKSKADLAKEMQQILRKDIQRGGGNYREALKDLRRIVRAIGGDRHALDVDMESDVGSGFGLEMQLDRYKQSLLRLENIRILDQRRLLEFADNLRERPGRNHVIFFYQREFRPEISPGALSNMMSIYQGQPNVLNDLQDLFHFYSRERVLDAELIKQRFADAALTFSFIFMDKESTYMFGAHMREQSEDIFPLFSGIARATGGVAHISRNAAVSFQSAAEASKKYYLLTYIPSKPEADGRFREIQVGVKGKVYTVSCRAGYYAR